MTSRGWQSWRWGISAALLLTCIALIPQISLWWEKGKEWQGLYAVVHPDEPAYSAYLNALMDGRPRRNDPYTGRDELPGAPQPESLFSLQFIPAYALAWLARLSGLSASSAFIALTICASFLSVLALFHLLHELTASATLSAAGALAVLCFGTLAGGYGEIRLLLGLPPAGAGDIALPFLRRYLPALVFPLFFAYCHYVRRAVFSESARQRGTAAIWAGFLLAVLIFSYFFLWTAAVAWLAGFILLFLLLYWQRRAFVLRMSMIVGSIATGALIPWSWLLTKRTASLDTTQALAFTHQPDFSWVSERIGLAIFIVLLLAGCFRLVEWKAPHTLMAASFALLPVIVFNQQVITGRVLQPIHYELFIANYSVVLAAALVLAGMLAGLHGRRSVTLVIVLLALAATGWGTAEAIGIARRKADYAKSLDEYMPVYARLRELHQQDNAKEENLSLLNPRPVVMSSDADLADVLPTVAPQAVLWSVHLPVYAGLRNGEAKERFHHYLYYSGITTEELEKAVRGYQFAIIAALFGYERALPALSPHARPITESEIRAELQRYADFTGSFTRQQAAQYPITYVVIPVHDEPGLRNLDRWYERDSGERINRWMLYRVHLKP